jgi:ABC-2 type transport system permease protein
VATPLVSGPPTLAPPDPQPQPRLFRKAYDDARELVGARELTVNLVRRELKARHRGTFLGMLWSLTNPILVVGLYYVIFKYILKASPVVDVRRPDHHAVPFAVYFFCGLVLWNLFSNSAGAATGSIVGSGYLLRKVYFPRAVLPLSTVLSGLVTFGFELAVLMVVTVIAVGPPGVHFLWVPVILAVVIILAYGTSLILAAVTVFLRDVAHFIGVLLQLWFWGTPIVYSLQYVSNRQGFVKALKLNPMTGAVVSFRNVVVLDHAPNLKLLGYDFAVALVVLAIGTVIFQRWERLFSEIV